MKFNRSSPEKRTIDGIVFDTIGEAETYAGLQALQRAGRISKLQWQTKFTFEVNDVHVGYYTADFTYLDEQQKPHVIDCKGWLKSKKTGKLLPRVDRDFALRKNLMLACFGLEVELL